MTTPFNTADGTPITFFRGVTADGHAWVLAYEGGPTATDPKSRCVVTGRLPMVCKTSGRVRSVPVRLRLNAQVSDLRSMLPHLTAPDVREYHDAALYGR